MTAVFFPLVVKMVSNRIETYVYGAKVTEYEDIYRTHERGHIALQHSGQDTRIAFRKLEIHEFEPESAAGR